MYYTTKKKIVFDFLSEKLSDVLLACSKHTWRSSKELLTEIGEVRQRLKTVFIAYFGDTVLRVIQVIQNTFLTSRLHPFVYRFVEYIIEDTPQGADGITSQLSQFFYRFYFLIVLKDEVFKSGGVFREWMHQTSQVIIRIIVA